MASLKKEYRNELQNVVLKARELAEQAAYKALHELGVQEADPPSNLSSEKRLLRRSLRAQARQLGDSLNKADGTHSVHHLAEKIAYDQWHRILFARFLAENDLLYYPEHGVAVTLNECADLAQEQGLRDGWEMATRFAAQMLPQIFRNDDPAGQIEFAPEDRIAIRKLVTGLTLDIFHADDSLGWVYQYWQAKRKEEINDRSKIEIGADELAPVTQLFTEDYMVLFLLHNTLGAWWAGKQLAKGLSNKQFETEADLRVALTLYGIEWEYLRFVKENDQWRPAAGTFKGWPKTAKEIRMLDPCMGSGHFLVFALPILAAMRQEEEGLSQADSVDSVLRENLFGLELDPRCTQIAAFNLAFAAWKMNGFRKLPSLNLACSGLGINAKKEDWLRLANGDVRLQRGMEQLYDLFQQAPILGSLIDPTKIGEEKKGQTNLLTAGFHELQPLLEKALEKEKAQKDETLHEMGVTAKGLAQAAEILAGKVTLVATNVPYLGRGKQDYILKDYCDQTYPYAKADIATCFVERCINFCVAQGTSAFVTTQYWLFLTTYKKLRVDILNSYAWNSVARLGAGAFETISGEVVNVALLTITQETPNSEHMFAGLDVSGKITIDSKKDSLQVSSFMPINQQNQLKNPNSKIILQELTAGESLETFAIVSEGLHTGDYPRFGRKLWELSQVSYGWAFQQGGVTTDGFCSGMEHILFWEDGSGELIDFVRERLGTEVVSQWIKGDQVWGRYGIAVGMMSDLKPALYQGAIFTHGICVIVPKLNDYTRAIRAFCENPAFYVEVRKLDQKVCAARDSIAKVPFDPNHWAAIAAEKYPHGLPKPHSDDPTQWLFHGHPNPSHPHAMINRDSFAPTILPDGATLFVAIARLLGYQWPRQTGSSFPDCPSLGPDGLEKHADDDGIVCINAIKGERPAAERLRALLTDAFCKEWNTEKLTELLARVGFAGSTIDDWLRNGFFEQHCQLFHQRPFIWQVWDGRRDGFSALVNYHKLDRPTLEKLTYTYLGDWITRQKTANEAGESGSDDRLRAARELQEKLKLIIEGNAPYDIFVRWKPLEKQPIGWNPDLNDGVRLNIRPFVMAGVLRKNPKINWNKDRGKDVESAPWFKKFKGERINDWHLRLEEKMRI